MATLEERVKALEEKVKKMEELDNTNRFSRQFNNEEVVNHVVRFQQKIYNKNGVEIT